MLEFHGTMNSLVVLCFVFGQTTIQVLSIVIFLVDFFHLKKRQIFYFLLISLILILHPPETLSIIFVFQINFYFNFIYSFYFFLTFSHLKVRESFSDRDSCIITPITITVIPKSPLK